MAEADETTGSEDGGHGGRGTEKPFGWSPGYTMAYVKVMAKGYIIGVIKLLADPSKDEVWTFLQTDAEYKNGAAWTFTRSTADKDYGAWLDELLGRAVTLQTSLEVSKKTRS